MQILSPQVELQELGKFLHRSDIISGVLAITLGSAFSAVLSAFAATFFEPVFSLVIPELVSPSTHFWVLRAGRSNGTYSSLEEAEKDGAVVVAYGKLLQALTVFLLEGLILFVLFRALSKTKHLPGEAGRIGAQLNKILPTNRA